MVIKFTNLLSHKVSRDAFFHCGTISSLFKTSVVMAFFIIKMWNAFINQSDL